MSTFTIGSRTSPRTVKTSQEDQPPEGSDDEPRPTQESQDFWLFENSKNLSVLKSLRLSSTDIDGKWMLFYPNSHVDAAWSKAKILYRKGQLTGIASMKVSTARENSRSSSNDSKVLIFYCGPKEKETKIVGYGQNLVEKMDYKSFNSNPFVYYKADEQTARGTKATGQTKNHLYKIKVPVETSKTSQTTNGQSTTNSSSRDLKGSSTSSGSSSSGPSAPSGPAPSGSALSVPSTLTGPSAPSGPSATVTGSMKRKLDPDSSDSDVEEARKRVALLSPLRTATATLQEDRDSSPSRTATLDAPRQTRIKFRLENVGGSGATTLTGTFTVNQRLSDLTDFLNKELNLMSANQSFDEWNLLKTFPTEDLRDRNMTLQLANLNNAMIIARRKSTD